VTVTGQYIARIDARHADPANRRDCEGWIDLKRISDWFPRIRDSSTLLTTGLADGTFVSIEIDWGASGIPLLPRELLQIMDEWYGSKGAEMEALDLPDERTESIRKLLGKLPQERLCALISSEL
jgi:hypothetical protein